MGEIRGSSVILQRFSVAFEYPVYFTSGFLDPANPVLAEAIARRERVRCPTGPTRRASRTRCAALLAELLPEQPGLGGTISTVPGAFKARVTSDAVVAAMTEQMVAHAAMLHRLRERTGRSIALALEPEPCCFLGEARQDPAAAICHHAVPKGGQRAPDHKQRFADQEQAALCKALHQIAAEQRAPRIAGSR